MISINPHLPKLQVIAQAQEHISLAQKEHDYYKKQCEKSKLELVRNFTQPDGFVCVPCPTHDAPPISRDMTLHISFDFAQQVIHFCNHH